MSSPIGEIQTSILGTTEIKKERKGKNNSLKLSPEQEVRGILPMGALVWGQLFKCRIPSHLGEIFSKLSVTSQGIEGNFSNGTKTIENKLVDVLNLPCSVQNNVYIHRSLLKY